MDFPGRSIRAFLPEARVLVVDAEKAQREWVCGILAKDYHLRQAQSGGGAIKACLEWRPDLIIMNIHMPDIDGIDTCRRIKAIEKLQHIPVIFLTASCSQQQEHDGWQAGASDLMVKPLSAITLKHRIKNQLVMKFQTIMLHKIAFMDGLTGLYNRHYLNDMLPRAVAYASRNSVPISLLKVDIDRFKRYADHYGFVQGDSCLKSVGELLVKPLRRPADIAVKMDGEAFICVLPDTPLEGAEKVAEALLKEVRESAITNEQSEFGVVTVSIGVAQWRDGMFSHQDLLEQADKSLYMAKQAGRNQFFSYPFLS